MVKRRPYRIVMVDDDITPMSYYRRALELGGYEVQFYSSVNKLEPVLSKEQIKLTDLFILDIMLTPGKMYQKKPTNEGLFTGLYLAKDIRKLTKSKPIIILSNITLPEVREATKQLMTKMNNCIVLQKIDYPPFELTDVVNRFFEEFELQPKRRRSIFRRLFDSLILQPNISGIGIDLKKIGEDNL